MRAGRSHTNAYSHSSGNGHTHSYANADAYTNIYTDCITYAHSNTHPNPYTDPVHREMWTHTEAVSDLGWATNSAPSSNTAACCFAERDPGAAAHSAASPHRAADAYRFAASYPATAPVEIEKCQSLVVDNMQ